LAAQVFADNCKTTSLNSRFSGVAPTGQRSPSTTWSNSSNSTRATAYRLRTRQRGLIADIHKSASLCGIGRTFYKTPGNPNAIVRQHATLVCDGEGHAGIEGVAHCKSAWSCPVCSPKIAAARGEALAPQITNLMTNGWSAHLLTLTVRHERGDDLNALFDVLRDSWQRVTSGRAWRDWRTGEGGQKAQFVRGFDLTYSDANGWHPHVHVMLLQPPGADNPEWVIQRWRAELEARGWRADDAAQDCRRVDNPEAAARYAVSPAAVYEAVAMSKKRARGEGSGLTPFEILARAVADDGRGRWAMLWRDYVRSTKSRRQVTTSRNLKLSSDDELDLTETTPVADIGFQALRELDKRELTADLLAAVEQNLSLARYAALSILSRLNSPDWQICGWGKTPPPD